MAKVRKTIYPTKPKEELRDTHVKYMASKEDAW